ncbi:AbiJ-NTD4 domain-containing protein [Nitrosopumilus sp.]|uniref:AbiJ-NTD4 domain-containing protein n=1 Tax=Nitrosopumilus sp. TaxID=2024843 RepID=UPI003B5974D9
MRDVKSADVFSIREGIGKTKKEIQSEGIDDDLKNSLWNAVFRYYLDAGKLPSTVVIQEDEFLKEFFETILYDFFKIPADSVINGFLGHGIEETRELFYKLEWHEIYDFIEFLANNVLKNDKDVHGVTFVNYCNKILERENSLYRFVDNKIEKIKQDN